MTSHPTTKTPVAPAYQKPALRRLGAISALTLGVLGTKRDFGGRNTSRVPR